MLTRVGGGGALDGPDLVFGVTWTYYVVLKIRSASMVIVEAGSLDLSVV